MSNFQIIFIGILIFLAAVGLITFAIVRNPQGTGTSAIVLWGTVPQTSFDTLLTKLNEGSTDPLGITYVEKDAATFDIDLAEAIAAGHGPDVILLPQDKIARHSAKISPIPFTSFPKADFQNSFVQESNMYVSADGILALPFSIDPLVMFWNRDLLTNASLIAPPASWNDFIPFTKALTQKTNSSVIVQSATGLGEFDNISHAKAILSTLFFQSGDAIVDTKQNIPQGALGVGAQQALRFYTQFANPTNEAYTWNRSLPVSFDAFVAGKLAVYFGFASELSTLRDRNSNLNLGVSLVPQSANTVKVTFANMLGLAVLKTSPNSASAMTMASYLSSHDVIAAWSQVTGLPPVRLDLLATPSSDNALAPVFYASALRSRAWYDPNPVETDSIFRTMVQTASSGQEKYSDAVDRANQEMRVLFAQ